jgi:tetratricopeptide (TPR) repeat protein
MRILIRSLVVAAFVWVGVVLYFDAQKEREKGLEADNTKVVLLFAGMTLVGAVAGAVAGIALLPAVGDAFGHFLYDPNEKIQKDPHSAAVAKLAQGDTEGAVEEYVKVWRDNPHDTHALAEIVHLYCDKLKKHEEAEQILTEAVSMELPPEEAGVAAARLADVYWNYQHDAIRAKEMLVQIAETMPNTKFAANAQHKLLEIDRALANEDPGFFLRA